MNGQRYFWRTVCSLSFIFCTIQGLSAGEILYEKNTPNLGINVYPLAEQTWRSKIMTCPTQFTNKDRIWSGPDFFTSEYGKPCVFTFDWLKKYGYTQFGQYAITNGVLEIKTGKEGFILGFGSKPKEFDRPSVRFGAAWGLNEKDIYRLRMTVEQDVEMTRWSFSRSTFTGNKRSMRLKPFVVKGKKQQVFEVDLGLVRQLNGNTPGFELHCLTPNATVKITKMYIAPSSANVYFRRTLTLAKKPVLAHATFRVSENFDLYVNEKKVATGNYIYPAGVMKTVDLAPYLTAGKNTLAFRREFISWSTRTPDWLFEGVAVDRDGTVTHILGDQSWRCTLAAEKNWMKSSFDDSTWLTPRLSGYQTALADGTAVATGFEPKHMGMLDAAPADREYPVFNVDETPAFRVRLPLGVRGRLLPTLEIRNADSKTRVETLAGSEPQEEGDFLVYKFLPKIRQAGPYQLRWTLQDAAKKTIETSLEEMILVGPIKQDTLPLAKFEDNFTKRLELVRTIDCTKPPSGDAEFIDHAGMYNPPKTNKGKVVTSDGMTYRETGSGAWDYFAYRLHLRERGVPHLIEVIVPDNRDRYIYSSVIETFPIPFCNNPNPLGSRGWVTACGAAMLGGRYPLSNGTKKIRYIYYPGSFAAAVVVMSGLKGRPAAAIKINIYRIKGGLPALKIPETKRMFGAHNERLSVMGLTMASENPLENDISTRRNGHRDAWYHWYKAIERKIRWLRFQGRNMSIEGVYMYNQGAVPSLRHNKSTSNQEFDRVHLLLRMYQQNKIHCLLGFEYASSPALPVSGIDTVSDRRMWEGTRGLHMVDRHGRQLVGQFSRDGVNFLHPKVEEMLLDTLGEIYDRYQGVGHPDGLFLVSGRWWAPGFVTGSYQDIVSTEVGYGDLTVGLFTKETGVKLDVSPTDPQRFQKRYDLLMGKYRALWLHWRGLKLAAFIQKMSDRIRRHKNKWPMYIYPSTSPQDATAIFNNSAATRKDRDHSLENHLALSGFPLELYAKQSAIKLVTPFLEIDYFPNRMIEDDTSSYHGWNTNSGNRAVMKTLDTLYITSSLNEVDTPARAAKKWLWSHTARGAYVLRGAEDNAMYPFVDAMQDATPKMVVYSWLDCQMETSFGSQQRRFAKALYSTPDSELVALPAKNVHGIIAQAAARPGGAWLRLVNNSPYPVSGVIRGVQVYDLVYDRALPAATQAGLFMAELKPNDIRLFTLACPPEQITCNFSFAKNIINKFKQESKYILSQKKLLRAVPGDMIARLFEGMQNKDAFALYSVLNNFEVAGHVKRAQRELVALAWQKKFLVDLARTGSARIDCAGLSSYIDPQGHRWLPDQSWLTPKAYGNKNASYADRGDLPIANTAADHVYQTEAYGAHVFYHLPVPNGNYNVYLHFAETYAPIKRAGIRLFSVKIENHLWQKEVDPFKNAGGFAKAVILSEKKIGIHDGVIDIELLGGVGIQGIEIEKVK